MKSQQILRLSVALGILGCLGNCARAGQEPPSTLDEQTFTGLSADEFQKQFDESVADGYRPIAIRGFEGGRQARYDLTMGRKEGGVWMARHGLSDAQFRRENLQAERDGYELTIHSRFRVGRVMMNAAVWETPKHEFLTDLPLPVTGEPVADAAALDEMMTEFLREHDIPGASLAVGRDGRVVYARGFGFSDLDRRDPVQPDSLFRIASLSKPITAAAIFKLIEAGDLTLDDRAFGLIDVRPTTGAPVNPQLSEITIRQLLQHTGGFDPDESFDPMFRTLKFASQLNTRPPTAPEDVIAAMLHRPLDFAPGERYAYSNFGYCVLGRVIETVSGRPYDEYVQDEILRPLGISRMQLGGSRLRDRADGEVRYYTRFDGPSDSVFGDGRRVPLQYGGWCLEAMDAHGGWIASAEDLVRFASVFDPRGAGPPLQAETVQEMFAPPEPPAWHDDAGRIEPYFYACGWLVRPVFPGPGANVWHAGKLAGTSTLLARRFDGFTWAVLFNCDESSAGEAPATLIDSRLHVEFNGIPAWSAE